MPFRFSGIDYLKIFFLLFVSSFAYAKSVTAPLSPDQGLINPAAATTRNFKGFSMRLSQQTEVTEALDLSASTLKSTIAIQSLESHFAWDLGPIYFGLDLLPQIGQKKMGNEFNSTENTASSSLKNELRLFPVQGILAIKLGNWASVGVKTLSTSAKVRINQNYQTNLQYFSNEVSETNELDTQFLVTGIGSTFPLFNSGIFAAYSAEYTKLKVTQTLHSSISRTEIGSTQLTVTDIDRTETREVRRDIIGLGYFKKFGRNAFRLEASYEKVPPLGQTQLQDGKLYRYIAEGVWSIFQFGLEWRRISGYYIDAYNLIPYYFKFEQFSNTTRDEFGVFGGLRTTKGHSLGLSYFGSSKIDKFKFSSSDETLYRSRQKTDSFSLGYTYIF